jgi:N-acetylglutamate synthase-like GNAT family acetyltransferase
MRIPIDPATRGRHAVIGRLEPSFDQRFGSFDTGTINGFARVERRTIEILAIEAEHQGRGDGGRFFASLQAIYREIIVWEIYNQRLRAMLARRGFVRMSGVYHGERLTGMRWRRPERRP